MTVVTGVSDSKCDSKCDSRCGNRCDNRCGSKCDSRCADMRKQGRVVSIAQSGV